MKGHWILLSLLLAPVLNASEEVKVMHILVKTLDEADFVRNEIIENGGSRNAFMTAARKYSKDVTTKRAGGALGWNTRSKFVKEFSEAAFNLKKDEVSLPVKSAYGWHLIYLEDRRDRGTKATTTPEPTPPPPTPTPPQPTKTPEHPPVKTSSNPPVKADLEKKTSTTPTPSTTTKPEVSSVEKVVPQKPRLRDKNLKLELNIENKVRRPIQTVEVTVTLINEGAQDLPVMSPDLLPLGFIVTGEVAPTSPPATWDAIKAKKPNPPLITLQSQRSVGATFSLNDYFKDLPPNGRYSLKWKPTVFSQNLKSALPEIAEAEGMKGVLETLNDTKIFSREVLGLEGAQRFRNYDKEVVFSVFDTLRSTPDKKYYASLEIDRQRQPIWIELFADRELTGVRHFTRLAQSGFYDWLSIFDIQRGSYMRSGSPTNDDYGGPERFVTVHPERTKIPHEKGTISMVTRPSRGGRQIGSIYFICRKAHPEWDGVHLPIGKIIQGEDVLDQVERTQGRPTVRKINVITADHLPSNLASISPASPTTPTATTPAASTALPVATIKTSKGEITVQLFEDDARFTVANFVELAESGFFNKDAGANKKPMTFYSLIPGYAVITGSPTNDELGNPGYRIRDESGKNKQTHKKGTLTMLLETDPQSGNPVPDTAGSQFMVCLKDVPAWNGLYTPFGQVTKGLDVLDKIQEGDQIESVTIVSKRSHSYKAQKIQVR